MNHYKSHTTTTPRPKSFWESLGPGIVTGAADDDPSGIATYSQAGAQIGAPILWTMLFTWPLMSAIQMISAQIGRVTGRGLAANVRLFYGAKMTAPMVLLLLVANIFNLGADISAMGSAANLVTGASKHFWALSLTAVSVILQVFVPYHRYAKMLKWLTFVILSYVAVVFFVRVPWKDIVQGTFVPTLQLNMHFFTTFVALLGTTISPYLFFWQSSQEVEEVNTHRDAHALRLAPREAPDALRWIRRDTLIGMAVSNLIAYFIMLATTATLHAHGITQIETSAQAAEALRPIAGDLCFGLFALGIIGTGLLALPVLAGSAAYAVGEALHFRVGLERKPHDAKRFYSVLTLATLLGVILIYTSIGAIQALYWSAVLNALISAPIMIVVMLMASRKRIMGEFTISKPLRLLGWSATAVMVCAAVIFFVTL